MEACRIPVDVCEAIMDEVSTDTVTRLETTGPPVAEAHRTLRACALTCRAWRVRAQFLLWVCACLDKRRLALFTVALRTAPKPLITARLWLEDCTFVSSAELFMHTFPDLRQVTFRSVDFTRGPHSMFRMRLPFFASITALELVQCTFRSWRTMLDVVWAFPNLASLSLYTGNFGRPVAGGGVDLSAVRSHLRACQRLTKIMLVFHDIDQAPPPSFTDEVFGSAVTELYLGAHCPSSGLFRRFITHNSFPSLRSITLATMSTKFHGEPYLHVIAASRMVPGILKKIVLWSDHGGMDHECCQTIVGMSEEVAGSPQGLPELLSGLEELTIRFNDFKVLEPCVAYVLSILPNMRKALRFEHLVADHKVRWKEYTLPVTQ